MDARRDNGFGGDAVHRKIKLDGGITAVKFP
jgi:hypothetical protein